MRKSIATSLLTAIFMFCVNCKTNNESSGSKDSQFGEHVVGEVDDWFESVDHKPLPSSTNRIRMGTNTRDSVFDNFKRTTFEITTDNISKVVGGIKLKDFDEGSFGYPSYSVFASNGGLHFIIQPSENTRAIYPEISRRYMVQVGTVNSTEKTFRLCTGKFASVCKIDYKKNLVIFDLDYSTATTHAREYFTFMAKGKIKKSEPITSTFELVCDEKSKPFGFKMKDIFWTDAKSNITYSSTRSSEYEYHMLGTYKLILKRGNGEMVKAECGDEKMLKNLNWPDDIVLIKFEGEDAIGHDLEILVRDTQK